MQLPPSGNLWSNPGSLGEEEAERLKAALAGLSVTEDQVSAKKKAATKRVRAFKTGVSFATLTLRTD